jgi:DNA-binding NarL/FixJ family response regulator
VNKIRVLLANHPLMIPEAIRQLVAEQEDMELVGDCRGPMKILQEVGRTKADAVILAQEGADGPGLCSQLLAVYPDLTILEVAPDLKGAFTQQLCARRESIEKVNARNIVEALCEAVRKQRGRMTPTGNDQRAPMREAEGWKDGTGC